MLAYQRKISFTLACIMLTLSGPAAFAGWLSPRIIEIKKPASVKKPAAVWQWSEKLTEAENILRKLTLKVSPTETAYIEEVLTPLTPPFHHLVTRHDNDREIALALLELKTGNIKTVIVTKQGGQLNSPKQFPISVAQRPNGISWNKWNTQYRAPDGYVVIKNSYPDLSDTPVKKITTDAKGKKRTSWVAPVEYFLYTPYSPALNIPELVDLGRTHVRETVARALDIIRNHKVHSQAFPGTQISDDRFLKPDFFEMLPLIEQTDMTEFVLDPRTTAERALVIIGTNGNQAYAKTGSYAGALGWVQFTKGTYDFMRSVYPEAKLMPDFKLGAADHLNSMIAAILLHDYHLSRMQNYSGIAVASDPRLEEYLAGAYNGGPIRITQSLQASISQGLGDWTDGVRDETRGYIVKLRQLHAMDIMQSSSVASASAQ